MALPVNLLHSAHADAQLDHCLFLAFGPHGVTGCLLEAAADVDAWAKHAICRPNEALALDLSCCLHRGSVVHDVRCLPLVVWTLLKIFTECSFAHLALLLLLKRRHLHPKFNPSLVHCHLKMPSSLSSIKRTHTGIKKQAFSELK